MNIGIRGIGTYIPTERMSAADIAAQTGIPVEVVAEKFGVLQKPMPGPEDTSSAMGIIAAQRALQDAGVSAESIDLLIWNGSQHKDYPNWLAGLKVAHELGAVNAWSFDMEAMCGSMMAALDIAKAMMLSRTDLQRVLIVSGYRNVDLVDLKKEDTHFMLDLAASGAALVLEKGHERNVILSSAFKGDGSFAEDCRIPVLGNKKWPPEPQDIDSFHFRVDDVKAFKEKLTKRTFPNFFYVIREALKNSGGLSDEDIDYLAILHFKRSAHEYVLQELGLSGSQTTYLNNYGHMGQNDQIISIQLGLEAGKIRDGSNIVMVGAGLGFVWASTVIQWGTYQP